MKIGTFVGGMIGLLIGIAFIAHSLYTQASHLDPPPIIAALTAVFGGAVGHLIGILKAKRKYRRPCSDSSSAWSS